MFKRSHQFISSLSFGMTSGVITALGMIVGLYSATNSRLSVVAGIITMAIADGLADAAGHHLSEESEVEDGIPTHTHREVWKTTLYTFLSVFGFILSFVPAFLIWEVHIAIYVGIAWGAFLLISFNYIMAREKKENPFKVIAEHLLLAAFVVIISYFVGLFIGTWIK